MRTQLFLISPQARATIRGRPKALRARILSSIPASALQGKPYRAAKLDIRAARRVLSVPPYGRLAVMNLFRPYRD